MEDMKFMFIAVLGPTYNILKHRKGGKRETVTFQYSGTHRSKGMGFKNYFLTDNVILMFPL